MIKRTFPNKRSTYKPEELISRIKSKIKDYDLIVLDEKQSNNSSIVLFEGADAVIGCHGGLFMHIRSCKPNTVIIEIQPVNGAYGWVKANPRVQRLMYASLGLGINLSYYIYYAEKFPNNYHDRYEKGIVYINNSHFTEYIHYALKNSKKQ